MPCSTNRKIRRPARAAPDLLPASEHLRPLRFPQRNCLGRAEQAAILKALTGGLTPTDAVTLDAAWRALDAQGQVIGGRAVIVLDEAQEIAGWGDSGSVQAALASTIKRANSSVAFVISGSEKHMLAGLFEADGGPLQGLGFRVPLPPIAREDWVSGRSDRYSQAEISVTEVEIGQIRFYSDELPLPTMLICQHTLDWLENDTVTQRRSSKRSPTRADTAPGS